MLQALLALALVSSASDGPAVSARVVDDEGKPVADAIVFVYGETPSGKPPASPALMDQVDLEFEPHVLGVTAGTKVRFPNKDDTHHHLYSFSPAKTFEIELYKGEPAAPVVFDKPGVVKIGCNIHDWMSGVILVVANPYFAKTGKDGRASVSLAEGAKDAELAVWHERLKGGVDATKRKLKAGAKAEWKVELKPERKKARRPADYR